MFKELNNEKLPEELKFVSGGSDDSNEFKFHVMQNIGKSNKSNEHFIDYLLSDFLAENKITIHLDTGNIYYDNLNMRENIYNFMHEQQDETKKLVDFELDISDDFEFYLTKIIAV